MITAMNRIYVVPEYAEQFEQRFRTRARLVDGMPGFMWNKVLRPVNPGDHATCSWAGHLRYHRHHVPRKKYPLERPGI